ncbi:MAG: hypothetical protein IPF78_04350 [Flavobacteriales bacterium]|nr:hypothetical protein [Flavobacteriales bacterium]
MDDAHQFGDLKSVIALLDNTRPDRSFRMVFTARRIALAAVKEATEGYRTGGPIELKPWSDEEIRTFLHEEYNIGINLYVDRILYMAKGNPRIAAMVASIIHKAKGYRGFQDVAHAFQLYYSKDKAAGTAWEDPGTLRVLWAFSFFRHIEGTKYQARVLPDLLPLLDMDMATFWAKARALDRLELLDLHGPEGPGLIADDTFGTYLVHRVLFQEKEVALDAVLTACFPKHREPIVIAINSVLNVFHTSGEEEYLAQAVSTAIAHFTEVNDMDTVGELHEAFWAIDPTRTLAYAQQLVEAVPEEPSTVDYAFDDQGKAHSHFDAALRLLGRFGECPDPGLRTAAAELMLRYLHRCPSKAAEVAGAMVAAFDMDEKAEGYQYLSQRELAQLLIGLSQKGDAAATGLFFATAKNFLSVQTWRILSTRKRNTVSSRVHRPAVNANLKKLRNLVWGHVFALWRNSAYQAQVIKVLREHMGGMYHEVSKKLLAFDAEHIASFCMDQLDPEDLDHCILVHELLSFWRRRGVRPKQALAAYFMNDVFQLKLDLSFDRLTKNIDTDELEDHDAWLMRLHALGEGTAPAALRRMMKPALLIRKSEKGGMFPLGVSRAMEFVLLGATEGDPLALAQELRLAFHVGNPLGLGPGDLLARAFDELDAEALEALLSSGPFEGRTGWWLAYFDELAKRGKKLADPGVFERTVMEAVSIGYHLSLRVLFHFQEQCPGLIVAITRTVIEKEEKRGHTEFWLVRLFQERHMEVKDLFAPFADDMELLQRAFYHTVCRGMLHKQAPVVFKALLEADASFAERWVNWRYQKEYYLPKPEDFKLVFIWQRADAPQLMDVLYAVACKAPKLVCGNDDYLTSFFLPNAGEEWTAEVAAAQDAWLRMHIAQDHGQLERCRVLMGIVHALPQHRRLALLEHFINQKPEDRIFRETVLELRFSRVTMKGPGVGLCKLEFYEMLRTCCKGLAGLKYRRLLEEAAKSTKEEVKEEEVEQMIEERW